MEYLNKIELQGVVGRVSVQSLGTACVMRFSMAVNRCYQLSNGNPVVETTWFDCSKSYPADEPALELKKGDCVYVLGRLNIERYTDQEGVERQTTNVICRKVRRVAE